MINEENIHKLLAKYLDNSLNEDEKAAIENWINANEKNHAEFKAYQKLWEASENIDSSKIKVDSDAAWNKVYGKIKQPRIRKLNTWHKVAAAITVITLLSSAVYLLFNQELRTIEHIAEQNKSIELSDQSFVELQKGSKLVYSENFNENTRKVKLEGTAKFVVAKSPKPFIVDAKDVEVSVLGTSFLVEANEKDSLIKISVYSGKVAVKSKKTEENVTLTKNQKAIYDISQSTFNIENSNKQTLTFKHTPLVEVLDTLSKVFNVKIVVNQEAIRNCVFSGHLSSHDVNQIIKQVCYSYGLNVENKQNKYHISGKPNC
ncbi:MAG: hypothetical protein CMC96_12245 [Flavobacteriales bacterium]|nr:hypothetical protein [Flavobacteriales bacterium]|tara:strand:- start:4650 stop:5600 length:951 start_codon:yes stop_codon:yes gene_type:complete